MEAGLRTRYPPPSDRECGPLFSRDLIWEGGDVRGHTPLRGALAARAAEAASRLREGPTGEEGLRRVVALMSSITNTASPSAESAAAVPPDVADGVFDGSAASRLLRDTLAACDADTASGAQHWIGVSRGHGASPRTRPAARLLGSAAAVPAAPPEVKPFDYGLYTSTPLTAGYGLWRVYLDQYYGSDLFPLPWYTWHLTVPATATVATIDDARGWVRLMASFPRVHDGLVYPDWAGVAARYDGVRVTFPAVIATQGIAFLTPHGPTAPAFWDVESTYRMEQDHRGIKQRYYPLRGFGSFDAAARFCSAHDELRDHLRYRQHLNETGSLAAQRRLFQDRWAEVCAVLQAA